MKKDIKKQIDLKITTEIPKTLDFPSVFVDFLTQI